MGYYFRAVFFDYIFFHNKPFLSLFPALFFKMFVMSNERNGRIKIRRTNVE